MSSAVAEVSTSQGGPATASIVACSTRLEPRGATSTTSAATRRASADGTLLGITRGDDHDVRGPAQAEQVVGRGADGDDHRRLLADERADCLQIGVVGGADDDDRAAGDPGGERGEAAAVEQELVLAAQEVAGGVRERVQLDGKAVAGLVHLAVHLIEVEARPVASSSVWPSGSTA